MQDTSNFKLVVVDDSESNIDVLMNLLGDDYQVSVAMDGKSALRVISQTVPDLVLLDVMMPGMDGYEVCRRLKADNKTKDIPVIFVTAKGEVEDETLGFEIGAVDYITKPISPPVVKARINTHLRLKQAQQDLQDLLSKTFSGTITVLTDILSLTNPIAFRHTKRIKNYVVRIAEEMGLPDLWEYELAAMLSHIGCIAVPPKILKHIYSGRKITDKEAEIYKEHPKVAYELLQSIPRLESVAKMIASQYEQDNSCNGDFEKNPIKLGSQILNLVRDFDQLSANGASPEKVMSQMRTAKQNYSLQLLDALERVLNRNKDEQSTKKINITQLSEGMITADDIYNNNNILMVSKGTELSSTIIKALQRHAQLQKINNELRVIESRPGSDLQH